MASSHFTDGRFHIFLETASMLAEAKVPERFPWSLWDSGEAGEWSDEWKALGHFQTVRAAITKAREEAPDRRQDFLDAELTPHDRGE